MYINGHVHLQDNIIFLFSYSFLMKYVSKVLKERKIIKNQQKQSRDQ